MASNIGTYYLNAACSLCDKCPNKDLILNKDENDDGVHYSVYCSHFVECEYVFLKAYDSLKGESK